MNKFAQGLWEQGVGISTFGIGADYDELMMKGIAEVKFWECLGTNDIQIE